MHKDELWQLFDRRGERIMDGGYDSALGNPAEGSGLIYGATVVWIYRHTKSGKIELLWQKRSATVDANPNMWDVSAGGHIKYGEPLIDAIVREVREEVGVDVRPEDFRLVEVVPRRHNNITWCYAIDWTDNLENFRFDDGEVSEVKWVSLEDVDEFRAKYAKKVLAKDDRHFYVLEKWFKSYGNN